MARPVVRWGAGRSSCRPLSRGEEWCARARPRHPFLFFSPIHRCSRDGCPRREERSRSRPCSPFPSLPALAPLRSLALNSPRRPLLVPPPLRLPRPLARVSPPSAPRPLHPLRPRGRIEGPRGRRVIGRERRRHSRRREERERGSRGAWEGRGGPGGKPPAGAGDALLDAGGREAGQIGPGPPEGARARSAGPVFFFFFFFFSSFIFSMPTRPAAGRDG